MLGFRTQRNFIVLIMLIQTCLIHGTFAQEQQNDQAKIEAFKRETIQLYQNLGINSIVDFQSFSKAYMGYFIYKGKLNGKPLISFFNYSIPNNKVRFITIDFVQKSIVLQSMAGHGMNSTCTNECGREQNCCHNTWGKPAIIFSNKEGSWRSSVGLLVAGEKVSPGGKIGQNLVLRGLEPTNSLMEMRGIKFHTGHNGDFYGVSQGCITLPGREFRIGYELLSNKTLIYAFEGNARQSYAGFEDNNEVLKAVRAKENTGFMSVPTISTPQPERTMADSKAAKSKASLASRAFGEKGIYSGYAMWGDTNDSNKLPIPDIIDGITILRGTQKFEECQLLSDSSWKDTVAYISSGGNPAERFSGQWMDFDKWAAENGYNDGETQELAGKRMAIVNDCVAMAHISTRTDFDKANINQAESQSSADGKITCIYRGPESQDYRDCLRTIRAHDNLLAAEVRAHRGQQAHYAADAQNQVREIKKTTSGANGESPNSQGTILNMVKGFTDEAAKITKERADIASDKIKSLKEVAGQIPTRDSLYDECVAKFTRHGTVGMDDFNDISNIYMKDRAAPYSQDRDYCLQAVSSQVQPIHNQKAREQVKGVLRNFGEEVVDYESKSKDLLLQASISPSMGNSTNNYAKAENGSSESLLLQNNSSSTPEDFLKDFDQNLTSNPSRDIASEKNVATAKLFKNKDRDTLDKIGKGFKGSDFSLHYSSSARPTGGEGNQNGIYDEDFYNKINQALQHPEQLESLHLSEAQMKEYQNQKNYFDSVAKNTEGQSNVKSISGELNLKNQMQSPILDKDLSLFDIISSRYMKKFSK